MHDTAVTQKVSEKPGGCLIGQRVSSAVLIARITLKIMELSPCGMFQGFPEIF